MVIKKNTVLKNKKNTVLKKFSVKKYCVKHSSVKKGLKIVLKILDII